MNTKTSPTARIDKMMGFDSAAMGDEREARILLQATSVGSILAAYVMTAIAAGLALTGSGIWAIVILIASSFPSLSLYIYASLHGIMVNDLMKRGSTKQVMIPQIIVGVMVAALIFGLVFNIMTGSPVIAVPAVMQSIAASISGHYSVAAGVAGGAVGAVVILIWTIFNAWIAFNRQRPAGKPTDPADIPDED